MKGFIETLYNGNPRLVNIYHIVSVDKQGYGNQVTIFTDETSNEEYQFYLCDETYDEIKRKIEEAQHG